MTTTARPTRFADVHKITESIRVRRKWNDVSFETEILAALTQQPAPGERLEVAFQRKEREVGELFARLTIAESRALHKRLTIPESGDPIAAQFARLVFERRLRLLAFLLDVRRREAIRNAR